MSDASDPGGLTPERYGELLATVLHFPNDKRAEVLTRRGQDVDAFEEAHRAWQEALIAEAMEQENALAVSFAVPFSATKKRLKKEQPTLDSLGALPGSEATGEGAAAGAADEEPTAPAVPLGQESATPVDVRSGASVGQILTRTDAIDASPTPPPAEVAPAAGEPAPAAPAPAEMARDAATPEPIDSTMTGDLPANFLAAAALPFLEGKGSDAVGPAADGAERLKAESTERLHVDDVTQPSSTGTELAFRSPFAGMKLPWEDSEEPSEATEALDVEEMQRALEGAQVSAPSSPTLTLEQYASFVVECRVYRERRPHVYQRYGVADAESAAALDDLFGQRFTKDPELRKRFLTLEAEYLQWLQQNRPR